MRRRWEILLTIVPVGPFVGGIDYQNRAIGQLTMWEGGGTLSLFFNGIVGSAHAFQNLILGYVSVQIDAKGVLLIKDVKDVYIYSLAYSNLISLLTALRYIFILFAHFNFFYII